MRHMQPWFGTTSVQLQLRIQQHKSRQPSRSLHSARLLIIVLVLLAGPLAAAADGSPQSHEAAASEAPPHPAGQLAAGMLSGGAQEQQQQHGPGPHGDYPPLPPQRVADVLLGLYQSYAGPLMKAATHVLSVGVQQAEHGSIALPQCQQTNVLLNSGMFPGPSWANLTAEEQALHPVNLVMMQLAYMVYRPLGDVTSCLTGMGADLSTLQNLTIPIADFSTERTSYVFRAGKERVFVMFRGSSEADLMINIECRQEQPPPELFGAAGGPQIKLHRGYWRAWQSLEPAVLAAVQELLKEVPSKEVWVVGHSLGAAMGSIAAMRLNALLPRGVAGVFMYGSPRSGNSAWASAYNRVLLHKTIRFSNYLDFAVRVPMPMQSCSLGSLSLNAATGRFGYSHVGRAVLMCPERDLGLTQFRVSPQGSDNLDCLGSDEVDATGATHQMGSYFDAWRRGHLKLKGTDLASDVRVQAVLCQGCTVHTARFKMEQVRDPARAGGPVTCAVDASCSSHAAFAAALSVGNITAPRAGNTTVCKLYMCQTPAAGR